MRTVILEQQEKSSSRVNLGGGPGAPIFQPGPQTRIYRAPVRAIAAARLDDDSEVWGQVMDISLGGCLFKADEPLEVGSELELRITIISEARRAVAEVSGVVRRRTEDGGRAAYGIELVGRNSEERRVLQWLYSQALR
jgi:hypothetical protein